MEMANSTIAAATIRATAKLTRPHMRQPTTTHLAALNFG